MQNEGNLAKDCDLTPEAWIKQRRLTAADEVSRNTFCSLLHSPTPVLNLAETKMLFFNWVKIAFYFKPENKHTAFI